MWEGRLTAWGALAEPHVAVRLDARLPGQSADGESGLSYNRHRYYDPATRCYTQPDPLGYAGGLRPHAYVADPSGWADPLGLSPAPIYDPLDLLGRPQGGYARVTPADLRPTASSPPTLNPPGWVSGDHPDHQQRSHIIADTLGGSGSDRRNRLTLADGSNHPGMSTLEGRIRRHVRAGNTVELVVVANYDGDNLVPRSVSMYAVDQNGSVIVDEEIQNGRRQRTRCCTP